MLDEELERAILGDKWFYRFPLPSGRSTEAFVGDDKLGFHQDRLDMVMRTVDNGFGSDWSGLTCLDLGAHQGFFSFNMARKGCKSVLGIEARPEHVEKAELIRRVHQLGNLSYQIGDAMTLDGLDDEGFDVVLMLGLVYHLENPVGALRRAAQLTRRLLVVETQIIPNMSGVVDWGSQEHCKQLMGVFGIINEGKLVHSDGITGIALAPSLEGVVWVLKKLGFHKVEVVQAGPKSYMQLRTGKRIVVAAWRGSDELKQED